MEGAKALQPGNKRWRRGLPQSTGVCFSSILNECEWPHLHEQSTPQCNLPTLLHLNQPYTCTFIIHNSKMILFYAFLIKHLS